MSAARRTLAVVGWIFAISLMTHVDHATCGELRDADYGVYRGIITYRGVNEARVRQMLYMHDLVRWYP